MQRILTILFIIALYFSTSIALADEEYKGKFEIINSKLIINKHKSINLHSKIEILSSTGRQLSVESLKYARAIKIIRDSNNNVRKIIVLGWWD